MTDYEIDQIIEYAESNQPDEYTEFMTDCREDVRIFESKTRQGVIEIDELS